MISALALPVITALLAAEPISLASPKARRLAVLVGANTAPAGRQTLRFAHRDAQRLRDALIRTGGVATDDAVLLLDPEPKAVLGELRRLSALARAEPRETVLHFYYSGHADESLLYPGGDELRIEEVRQELVNGGATVRVGIFDACRGGSWTRAKGVSSAAPVEIRPAWALASEGTVLFASSSGLEEAHESDRLQGSFFTHHLVGGLLGAADASGDGTVTATEAFQYAQAQTVRDSARASVEPQHPSFELNLHGRKDLVLAQLEEGSSTLAVEQATGPLQVIELPLGLVLLELPEGKRSSRLSVAPGRYLIRHVRDGGVVTAREVGVTAGETTTIDENSLVLVGDSKLERKGDGPLPVSQETILPVHTLSVGTALGVEYKQMNTQAPVDGTFRDPGFALGLAGRLHFTWTPFERLEVSFLQPGISVMLGTRHEDEVLLSGGLDAWGVGTFGGVITAAGKVACRHWFSPRTSLAARARYQFTTTVLAPSNAITYNYSGLDLGLFMSHTFAGLVSFNLGASAYGWPTRNFGIRVGSGGLGFRGLPLVQVHLSPSWTLNFDAGVAIAIQPRFGTSQQFLLGATYNW